MIDCQHPLPVTRQCRLVAVARSSVYYTPQPLVAATLALMRQLDELHLQHPFAGSRMLRDLLRLQGVNVGRKHVATLMRRMGIAALYQGPRTTQPHPGHAVFPYLLRTREITAPNQVWAMDIPTSRCAGASSTWWPCSTGPRGGSWPGASRIP